MLLGMSPWFTAAAVSPQLQTRWGLDIAQAGWLTGVLQLGFVAGTLTAAVLNLADVFQSKRYFAASALGAAAANAALLAVDGYTSALLVRFATGFFLAGVYPPAMKMAATWFRSNRGFAIGTLIGALTAGKASPYLADTIGGTSILFVVLSTSLAAALSGAIILMGYRDGPHAFSRRPFSWSLAGSVLTNREWRLATGGYLGHMWELYAFWTWIGAFLGAAALTAGSSANTKLVAFAAIAIGAVGCVWGGRVADRIGYESFTIRAMSVSGACAVLSGVVFGESLFIVVPLVLVWGFFVIADSAQFSALVTEVVPDHAVGTALTLQTSFGFLLTMVTIQLVPLVAQADGWRWAFAALALGPAFGIASIARLRRFREGSG
jgi:MFS family permease